MQNSSCTLKQQLDSATNQLIKVRDEIEEKITELKKLEENWNSKLVVMEENAQKAQNIIKIDVGGKIFKTSRETLLTKKDTFFYAMLSSGKWLPDSEGAYFIDRNPKLFSHILDYLRYGEIDMLCLSEDQKKKLQIEADFYLISDIFPSYKMNTSNSRKFIYSSDFDSNGLLYWLGTKRGIEQQWTNPNKTKCVDIITEVGYYCIPSGNSDISIILERNNTSTTIASAANSTRSSFILDLKFKFLLTHVTLACNFSPGTWLREVQISVSSDCKSWSDVNSQRLTTNNESVVKNWSVSTSEAFRYIKIQSKSQDQTLLSGMEIYGIME